jgi:hypothetical protein
MQQPYTMGCITLDLRPLKKRHASGDRVPMHDAHEPVTAGPVPRHPGEWLLQCGLLSQDQLEQALSLSRQHDWRIGDAVVVLRFASRARVEVEAPRFERCRARPDHRRLALEDRLRWLERRRKARLRGSR